MKSSGSNEGEMLTHDDGPTQKHWLAFLFKYL